MTLTVKNVKFYTAESDFKGEERRIQELMIRGYLRHFGCDEMRNYDFIVVIVTSYYAQIRLRFKNNRKPKQKMPDNEQYINHTKIGKLQCKLKFDFDKWKQNETKYNGIFRSEIADALKINSALVKMKKIGRGSVIIDFWVLNIWIPLHVSNFSHDPIPRAYNMRPNDQIEVKYKHVWHESTISEVKMSSKSNGKLFKVRYNPQAGKDLFTKNTEWFCSLKEGQRLRMPNQIIISFDEHGAKINTEWQPKPLAPIANILDVEVGQHIYVQYKGTWYRCEVIEARNIYQGTKIQILYLVHGFWNDTEWMELWNTNHLARISLADVRPLN